MLTMAFVVVLKATMPACKWLLSRFTVTLIAGVESLGANIVSGGNGAALGLLCAWAVPDLAARRRGEETDSDMLGVAVIAGVLLLLPVAVPEADPLAGLGGVVVGFAIGFPLATLSRAR